MSWSLTLVVPEEPELLDLFFTAVGKSLYLSNGFEYKCSYLLRFIKISEHYFQTNDADATHELAQALDDTMLGKSIAGLKDFPEFSAADIALLHRGREARNFIAHEGAALGGIAVRGKHIIENIMKIRPVVTDLAHADNLVSRWLYEIEEQQQATEMVQNYPVWVDRWVFRPVDEFLRDYRPIERKETGSERILRMMNEPRKYPDYVR